MNLEARKTDSSMFESFFAVCILMGGMATASADPSLGPNAENRDADRALRHELRGDKLNVHQADANKLLEERRRLATVLDGRNDANKRINRLTPEERRDLRRHINQAGQDIYTTVPKE
jgi:hypothetical protein